MINKLYDEPDSAFHKNRAESARSYIPRAPAIDYIYYLYHNIQYYYLETPERPTKMSCEAQGSLSVIDGPDGAGKTTQKELHVATLQQLGIPCEGLVEPGGTPIGKLLRQIILDPEVEKTPETEFDLFTASRRELARQVTRPAIERGIHLVSDRGWYSAVAYQGFGHGLKKEVIIERNKEALGELFIPDASVILDVPPEVSEERLAARGGSRDWFESMGKDFFSRVREGFLWVADEYNIPLIAGDRPPEIVQQDIFQILGSAAVQ